jgi:hypothetical protein
MAYLTTQLITDAYYLSGIVSRNFETATDDQTSDGLNLLNDVIADRTIDHDTIPYTDQLLLNAVAGQSVYPIPNLIDLDVFVFYINGLRFQTTNQQRTEFFGSFRQVDIQSLPFNWHVERNLNGATLYLYFVPDMNYPLEIWGQFRLTSVTLMQDLSLTLDNFYTNFLKYLLSQRLCEFNAFKVPQNVMMQLDRYNQWITNNTNVLDLRTQKYSSLSGGGTINYAIANLSGGWLPSSR